MRLVDDEDLDGDRPVQQRARDGHVGRGGDDHHVQVGLLYVFLPSDRSSDAGRDDGFAMSFDECGGDFLRQIYPFPRSMADPQMPLLQPDTPRLLRAA